MINRRNIQLIAFIAIITFSIEARSQEKITSVTPIFKDGLAQVVPEFSDKKTWINHQLWVETEFDTDGDGKLDRMHVDVIRPCQTDSGLKLPVIYISSPYYGGLSLSEKLNWDVDHELNSVPPPREFHDEIKTRNKRLFLFNYHTKIWVPRGYVVVYSSSPGTGFSQGSPTIGGDNESLAQKAVIDWLCGRANGYKSAKGDKKVEAYWSTGKVGMTGTSYNGTLALAAATTGVEGLEAIIPVAPNTSYYHYYRSNGLIRNPGGYIGEDVDVLFDAISSGDKSIREYSRANIRDKEMAEGMDRIKGDYNDFWASRDYINDLGAVKAAMLMSHGFNDWNVMPEHSYRIYEALKDKVPTQIYYHQGGHGGAPPVDMMNKWFTRYLFGIENGVENDPKAWIVRENGNRENPTPYEDYPNPDAEDVELFLTAGDPVKGGLTVNKQFDQGKETIIDDASISAEKLAKAEESDNRVLYVTPVLTKPVHISGVSSIKIKLSCNKPAANLSVYLISLPWDGGGKKNINSDIITRGWADPQNYRSLTDSEPLEPGKFYEMEFNLQPDDQIIPEGQQIGLMIFSSDSEFTLHPKPGTELTIDLDSTSITIPVVGGKQAFESAVE